MSDWETLSDAALVDRLQRGAFSYFIDYANGDNGLVADTSRPESPCSIAVVGFALSSYPIAVESNWIARGEAVQRTLATLRFFMQSAQGEQEDATGYKGFYYHFLDMRSGRRVWQCELSLVDTSLLIAGVLTAAAFFDGDGDEIEIRELADAMYRRIDWRWAQAGQVTLAQGWKPGCGFLHYGWEGYNEATLLYVLALGSPTHPLSDDAFAGWTMTYQWENMLGRDVLYSGPLFTHYFSHAWIDFRGIRDRFMREKNCDYFENSVRAIATHREYGARNPRGFVGYDRNFWGITAGDGPTGEEKPMDFRDRRFFGYMSRGIPFGPDDGTISPWAMLAALPFDAEAALVGTRQLLQRYPQTCSSDRFSSGFNPSLTNDGTAWLSEGCYGLDQGLLVMMIDNAQRGLAWKVMRENAYVRAGLGRAGFSGGWLGA
ncbi:MAG: glucoamylase family protein [Rudaea sp.]